MTMAMQKKKQQQQQLELVVAGLILWVSVASATATGVDRQEILVGGKEGWHYGFNYSHWASTLPPIHVGDVLVFKYEKPQENTFPHNVYLMKNKDHYKACNVSGGTLLAKPEDGSGARGYRFVLRKPHRYYFACAIGKGIHCEQGLMKFGVSVNPKPSSPPQH